MAKKTSLYAKALVESLDGVSEKEVRTRIVRFKTLLKKRGDLRLLSAVLAEFAKLWEQRKGKVASVVFARKPSALLSGLMKRTLQKQGYSVKEEQNELLIGGAAVFMGNEYLLDNSVQGKLHKLRTLLKI